MTQATTIQRNESTYGGFRLDNTVGRVLIPVTGADGLIVAAAREFGSAWSTVVLSVKRISGTGSVARDFSTAKTIAAGGGYAALTPEELAGVDWIEVAYSSGAAEATGTTAIIRTSRNVMQQGHVSVVATAAAAGSLTDGDKGDITVSGTGTVWTLDLNLATIDAPTTSVNFADQQALSFRIENRTSDPGSPTIGQMWIRTDLL